MDLEYIFSTPGISFNTSSSGFVTRWYTSSTVAFGKSTTIENAGATISGWSYD